MLPTLPNSIWRLGGEEFSSINTIERCASAGVGMLLLPRHLATGWFRERLSCVPRVRHEGWNSRHVPGGQSFVIPVRELFEI